MIFGVITEIGFRRYQRKHKNVLFSTIEDAQFIEYNGVYYRDDWLRALPDGCVDCVQADIITIDEEEYNELKGQLDDGTFPEDGSLDDVVPTEPSDNPIEEEPVVRKTVAQMLDEQMRLAARYAEV